MIDTLRLTAEGARGLLERREVSAAELHQAYVEAIGERYQGGARQVRGRILDEIVSVTGYHRKHAMRVLRGKRRGDVQGGGKTSHGSAGELLSAAE